jgi:hypothetical protein
MEVIVSIDHASISGGESAEVSAADDCTFSMLAAPSDWSFVDLVLRHLLRMCAHDFRDVLVVVDDLPKKGRPADAAHNLQAILSDMQRDAVISRVVNLSAVHQDSERICQKYLGRVPPVGRDRRGIPLLGWIAGLDAARTDFVVHFDSDILLHQDAGHRWLTDAMHLMRCDASAMFVAPRPGPPTPDGGLRGQPSDPTFDSRGNFRFKHFSSRRFLVSKRRLEAFLPTPLLYTTRRDRVFMRLGFGSAFQTWEECVSVALKRSDYFRVHLHNPGAWSLHCKDHSPEWVAALPAIIARVERGEWPEAQAGRYELRLSDWL